MELMDGYMKNFCLEMHVPCLVACVQQLVLVVDNALVYN